MSNALVKADPQRHPMLELVDGAMNRVTDGDGLDISFLSKSFCMSGLPLRRQFERDKNTRKTIEPQREVTSFSRKDERFALSIASLPIELPAHEGRSSSFQIGLPYGARARCLVIWMTTQARLTGSRWLELGKVESWLEEAGISAHVEAAAAAKEQLLRLTYTIFSMALTEEEHKHTYFHRNQLISSTIFPEEDLEHYVAGELTKVRFPLGIELSDEAFRTFTGSNVVPVSTEQLRRISNNPMSIDIFCYLNYRLPLIAPGRTETLGWRMLVKQFGNGESNARFRQVFQASIVKALEAYAGANVEITDAGLELRYSDPAELRKTLVAVSKPKLVGVNAQSTRVRNRIAPPPGVDRKTSIVKTTQLDMEF